MVKLADRLFGTVEKLKADLALSYEGPCLVLGSAPTAVLPEGFDASWTLICMNGSQAIAAGFGLPAPDVVLMRGGLFGQDQVDREAQEALRGLSAKTVLVRNMDGDRGASVQRLRDIEYEFEQIRPLHDKERSRIIYSAFGSLAGYLRGRKSISAGVISVMLAAAMGKTPIVITGISLATAGHFYSESNLPRKHVAKDRNALRTMARRGVRLFTTDALLAQDIDIPVWHGKPSN